MPQITANGLTLEYEEHGDRAHPPILLIMGLGAQLTYWPIEFVDALVAQGFRVIRFDNRDIGLSQKFDGAKAPGMVWQILRQKFGFPAKVPYSLKDMADDAAAVLDALEIERAHVVGASMGGMIGQLFAVHHAHKMISFTSIFSTTGDSKLPQAEKAAIEALTTPPPSMEEGVLIENGIKIANAIGSPGFRPDPEWMRDRVRGHVQRSVYPAGLARQLAAIIDDGDRTARLANVSTPTLVLHGDDDPLVKVEAGHATAAAIDGASITTWAGWGHDLPMEMVEPLTQAIAAHARAATNQENVAA
ncbi:MAG: alpha/beta hydrolase [Erythrobacter sp.]